jgi:uncharacterized protein with HEPN domain
LSRSDAERIADILDASGELGGLVGRGKPAYDADVLLQRAAERLLEIIGEAASTLSDELIEQMPDVAWRDVRRLRIVLAHHYHRVDPDQVWEIAAVEVPVLAERLSPFES